MLGTTDIKGLHVKIFRAWLRFASEVQVEAHTGSARAAKAQCVEIAKAANALAQAIQSSGTGVRRLATWCPDKELLKTAFVEGFPAMEGIPLLLEEDRSDRLQWTDRLEGLEKLALWMVEVCDRVAKGGGRRTLYSRFNGSPKDNLAKTCTNIVEGYGCKTQAVALRLVRAIIEMEEGRKPSRHEGRKAIRKVAQTSRS